MKDTECYVNKAEVKRKIRVWLDYRTSRQVTDGLLDLIEKLPVTVKGQLETTLESEWVSVKDRMPEPNTVVLVHYADGKICTADYIDEYLGFVTSSTITHWMPLPTPPESEDDVE